ncbi:MAG: N-acetyl-gamma-glutamyl-phosphate reductase [Anaerolineae bacterium]|nr:N-acetyl-gamma-glutamyl-phosphate reductase [Anaerolineae bacterium]
MLQVGIIGATGYTGYELVKIFQNHPQAKIAFATSQSSAGQLISDLYPCPFDLPLIALQDADLGVVDVLFLCLPHGESMSVVKRARQEGVRTIDLSADFRLQDVNDYQQWYKTEHIAPELLPEAVYGLPEVYRERIVSAGLVACPGCYPTSALLALYPLAKNRILGSSRIIIDSKSGVSGAGRKLTLSSLFVEANENFVPYSIGHSHRHLSEMEQELNKWGETAVRLTFSPHLLPVDRGILSTIYVTLKPGWSVDRLIDLYSSAYAGEPFLHVLPAGKLSSLAFVTHSNSCVISFARANGDDFIIVSAIDNLLKGASGQAVQNMNLMFGLDETTGLVT